MEEGLSGGPPFRLNDHDLAMLMALARILGKSVSAPIAEGAYSDCFELLRNSPGLFNGDELESKCFRLGT